MKRPQAVIALVMLAAVLLPALITVLAPLWPNGSAGVVAESTDISLVGRCFAVEGAGTAPEKRYQSVDDILEGTRFTDVTPETLRAAVGRHARVIVFYYDNGLVDGSDGMLARAFRATRYDPNLEDIVLLKLKTDPAIHPSVYQRLGLKDHPSVSVIYNRATVFTWRGGSASKKNIKELIKTVRETFAELAGM